jgi:hypothetical protein
MHRRGIRCFIDTHSSYPQSLGPALAIVVSESLSRGIRVALSVDQSRGHEK